jgi:hypothetical protein
MEKGRGYWCGPLHHTSITSDYITDDINDDIRLDINDDIRLDISDNQQMI